MYSRRNFQGTIFFLIVVEGLLLMALLTAYMEHVHPRALSPELLWQQKWYWPVSLFFFWAALAYAFGLYVPSRWYHYRKIIRDTLIAGFVGGLSYSLLPFLAPYLPKNRSTVFIFAGAMMLLLLLWRIGFAFYARKNYMNLNTVVLGASEANQLFKEALRAYQSKTRHQPFNLLDEEPGDQALFKFLETHKIEQVLVNMDEKSGITAKTLSELFELQQQGLPVQSLAQGYERITGKIMVIKGQTAPKLVQSFQYREKDRIYLLYNRIFNFLFGLIGSLITVLVLPFVIVGNMIGNRGPLFYTQQRVGRGGKAFKIYKLRTMVDGPQVAEDPHFTQPNDSRITPFGKWLRRVRIDELPQLLNILKGDMNFIGPRPEVAFVVEEIEKRISFYKNRHTVKPGLTGWAQTNFRYGFNFDDSLSKLQYDLYYIKYRSLWLDLRILLKTVGVVVQFKGS